VGPRAGLDTEARGKILCPRRGSNPDRPVVQPLLRHYTKEAKSAPLYATEALGGGGERRYSSYSFSTLALGGGEWSVSRPGRALPPGKGPPVPIVAGWASELVWI
jgi:hypothetical protein